MVSRKIDKRDEKIYLLCFLVIFHVLVGQATSVLEVPVSVGCPKQWIGFGSKCFYFSEDARNWTFSQAFCVSLEADLVQFETLEELVRNVFRLCSLLNT